MYDKRGRDEQIEIFAVEIPAEDAEALFGQSASLLLVSRQKAKCSVNLLEAR